MFDIFNDPTVMALKKDLDTGTLRQKVIANNLANLNTPGFKKSFVSFEEQLQASMGKDKLPMRTTRSGHIGGVKNPAEVEPKVEQQTNTSLRPDGNNVDADEEMVNLAATQVKYNTSAQALSGYYSLVSQIISSSRR
ncbi:MAG: flagellar basal body rod protein FlgB [Firmicutes bacterium]|nr:flagellar basal body rod protein FlgB [Bacillota bacterium]